MRNYRWALQYDRNVTSKVNPEDDFEAALADEIHEVFVNPAHVTVSGPHFVTGINPEVIEAPEFDDTEPSTISLPDHADWY